MARIGALSKGSNGQRSIESAPLQFKHLALGTQPANGSALKAQDLPAWLQFWGIRPDISILAIGTSLACPFVHDVKDPGTD